jgi:hypothetical protein
VLLIAGGRLLYYARIHSEAAGILSDLFGIRRRFFIPFPAAAHAIRVKLFIGLMMGYALFAVAVPFAFYFGAGTEFQSVRQQS